MPAGYHFRNVFGMRRPMRFRIDWGSKSRAFYYREKAEDFYLEIFAAGHYPRMINMQTWALMYSEDPRDDGRHRYYGD